MRALVAIACLTALARAQPVPCEECDRGNAQLDALGDTGATLRASLGSLADAERINIEDALTRSQYERLTAWHDHVSPQLRTAITSLGKQTDQELLWIAFALCGGNEINCARHVSLALRCLSRPCDVQKDPVIDHTTCDPTAIQLHSAKRGLIVEYGTGWQTSAQPTDGRVWSLGVEGRQRLTNRVGLVARIDHMRGRDAAIDDNGDGRDDISTGLVTRWSALAGPSVVLGAAHDDDLVRYLQLDTLVGYLWAQSSGPALAFDLSYHLVIARVGVRVMQGLGDAAAERALIAHVGLGGGAAPQLSFGAGCDQDESRTRSAWAIGMEIPISGYSSDGYVAPGFALEGARHVSQRFDVLVHGDLLGFPRGDKDRALHQSVLAGGRIDFSTSSSSHDRLDWFATLLAGYAFIAAPSSDPIQSGIVGDVSVGGMMPSARRCGVRSRPRPVRARARQFRADRGVPLVRARAASRSQELAGSPVA